MSRSQLDKILLARGAANTKVDVPNVRNAKFLEEMVSTERKALQNRNQTETLSSRLSNIREDRLREHHGDVHMKNEASENVCRTIMYDQSRVSMPCVHDMNDSIVNPLRNVNREIMRFGKYNE